jgi:CMP-N-acetylneuraminic acid synthetase
MIYNKKVTALVPIKGETEIVNGNLRLFNNQPLYRLLLEKLEHIFAIDEIIVDSDLYFLEDELLSSFKKVKFVKRPAELQNNETSINEIIRYDISQSTEGELFIQTHVNKPLVKKETIAKALKLFVEEEDNYDSLLSVNKYQSRFYDNKKNPINHDSKNLIRTKELPPVYEENSCFYIFTRESFEKNNHRIGENPLFYETSTIESLELKDNLSYKLAEILTLYQEL